MTLERLHVYAEDLKPGDVGSNAHRVMGVVEDVSPIFHDVVLVKWSADAWARHYRTGLTLFHVNRGQNGGPKPTVPHDAPIPKGR